MRKAKSVIGKDVLSYLDGRKVHSVKDMVVGADNSSIVALLVDEGGLFGTARVVPIENVVSFGKDAAVISDANAAIPADSYPAVAEVLDRDDKLIGKKVFTEGGDEVGSVSDIYFEEGPGTILGYEVSGGLIKNVAQGTSYLPLEDVVNIGPDVILVKSEAVYSLDEQKGGVQGALQSAGDKAGGAVDSLGDRASMVFSSATQSPETMAVGRRAMTDVEADDGGIIVAGGQRITQSSIDQARRYNKLDALLQAAGVSQGQGDATTGAGGGPDVDAMRDKAGEALGKAGDKAGQVAGQVGDKAGSLWDAFTQKISEVTDSAGNRLDEEKTKKRLSDIQDAIGRPVTKVILDKEDNVILNLGDIITHEAVQRSYDAGMLDTLLGNVFKGDVQFTRDELRVQEEGDATVEKASGNAAVIDEMEQKVETAQQQREEEREQREQERQERDQQREQDSQESGQSGDSGGNGGDGSGQSQASKGQERQGRSSSDAGDDPLENEPTEPHVQAQISDEEFSHRAGDKGQEKE